MPDLSPLDLAWSNLEPGCAEIAKGARDISAANQLLLLSAATSLKRIADALTLGENYNIASAISGIEMGVRN